MKPHPRPPVPRGAAPALRRAVRKIIKWGGLALCLLLAGVWMRSEYGMDYYGRPSSYLVCTKGAVHIGKLLSGEFETGYQRISFSPYWPRFWWLYFGGPGDTLRVGIPLWLPLAPTLLATAAAWRLDALARRRACAGLCPKCGYDRAGLAASAVCPECGSLPAEPAPHA